MAIASLFNVPVSPETTAEYAFNHMAHHRDVNRRILEIFNVIVPEFALDPMNLGNLGVWGNQHQQMHNDTNFILGVEGNDLTDVSWSDINERTAWIFLNSNEHYQWSNLLGV